MSLNIEKSEIGKVFKGNIQIGKVYKGAIYIYSAAPDYLYKDGEIDGEYLTTMTGSNSWNDDGYGYETSDFSLNKDGSMYLSAGASSGYGNTYSCENKAESNYMDLSGAESLHFIGDIYAEAAYHHWQWGYIDLIDKSGKEVVLVSVTAHTTGSNYVPSSAVIDHDVSITGLGLDLSNVKIRLRYGYRHNAPWSNWYGGSGRMLIESIIVNS